MEVTIITAITAIAAVALLICFWALYCNQMTYRQRMALIELVSSASKVCIHSRDANWHRYYEKLNQVSYGQHHRAVLFFRDPINLYHPDIVSLMQSGPSGQAA